MNACLNQVNASLASGVKKTNPEYALLDLVVIEILSWE